MRMGGDVVVRARGNKRVARFSSFDGCRDAISPRKLWKMSETGLVGTSARA
jgi:hypothetical protein